ncbi:MAG: LuxR C-terminal-related transcriptional regulator, partial [Prevotellaceae bacterium]|jgi:DNA-binding NarL/FixJ family response regulator|nr:LuxR C-terminal-related transcriptional regulator [Prevotellaceae bacterium]
LKNSEPEEMLESICTVAAGGRFLCDEVEATLQKNNSNTMQFTRRELELLRLIAEGLTQSDLADRMCLSIYTIRSYRKTLNLKLCAHNTVQLLQNAKALHLL